MPATYRGYIDWNNDNDFIVDLYEDVTERILDGQQAVRIRYGRDLNRAYSPISAGEAHFTLDNRSRDYSPENTSSPLTGSVLPARPAQFTATLSGVTTTLFAGVTDNFELKLDMTQRWVDVDCLDSLGQLHGVALNTALYRGMRSGEAVHAILDAANWPSSLRDIDAGASVFPYWWLDGDDAFQALLDVVSSEGPPALVTVDAQRRIVFRDRHHRLQRTASTTSQSTWRSGDVEPCFSQPATYNNGYKEIANVVAFNIARRSQTGDLSVVWQSATQISVASGDTLDIEARGSSPFTDAFTPVSGTDYTLVTGTADISLNRTSGATVTISVKSIGGGTLVIRDLQLRANALVSSTDQQIVYKDWASISKYGWRSAPTDLSPKWCSQGDGRAIATLILAYRAERPPIISVTLKGSAGTTRIFQIINRNLSDRVHITDSQSGLDADCHIEQIDHTITQGGTEHTTVFGTSKALAQLSNAFTLGSATAGVLGTNVLGRRGIADPATMLVLGTGVLGTSVLTP